jgi:hypothetical protein
MAAAPPCRATTKGTKSTRIGKVRENGLSRPFLTKGLRVHRVLRGSQRSDIIAA